MQDKRNRRNIDIRTHAQTIIPTNTLSHGQCLCLRHCPLPEPPSLPHRPSARPKEQVFSFKFTTYQTEVETQIISPDAITLKARKQSVTAYTAFKWNSTIRKMSSDEKQLQYLNTTIALFLYTAINTTIDNSGIEK